MILDTTCIIQTDQSAKDSWRDFLSNFEVQNVLLVGKETKKGAHLNRTLTDGSLHEASALKAVLNEIKTPYAIFVNSNLNLNFSAENLNKFMLLLKNNGENFIYCDYEEKTDASTTQKPLIDYQVGSCRDDFDFGPVIAFDVEAARSAFSKYPILTNQSFSALYALRLTLSLLKLPFHITESLYTIEKADSALGYEDQFSYVDPKNSKVQKELEETFTTYAKFAGFYLPRREETIRVNDESFSTKASVVIPVKNREGTVAEAVQSALSQETSFLFNVIVVDNHSTDGTTAALSAIAKKDSRLIHIIPEETDLLIGGCWNKAILSPDCGQFAVQLDSDDLYSSTKTLQKIIDLFHAEKSAAVIGSYNLVNFDLKEIPPGIIDHKEWTDENGHNNALRIHGLGAPRALATSVAREILFPNVSYGEDYTMILAICRRYKISRIFEPIYLCRRWEGNSDANLSQEKKNINDFFKDGVRSREIATRTKLNGT